MDFQKGYEREKRINKNLKAELESLKTEHNELLEKCMEPDIEVTELIATLKQIKADWLQTLDNLKEKEKEYDKLIKEMKEFRNNIMGSTRLQRIVAKKLL